MRNVGLDLTRSTAPHVAFTAAEPFGHPALMVSFVPMVERLPFLDVLIAREHGDTWRMYFGPASWCPPSLRARLDEYREIFPVSRPRRRC